MPKRWKFYLIHTVMWPIIDEKVWNDIFAMAEHYENVMNIYYTKTLDEMFLPVFPRNQHFQN